MREEEMRIVIQCSEGQSGPLVIRLESFSRVRGLVVGPWGECSTDMHALITGAGGDQGGCKVQC